MILPLRVFGNSGTTWISFGGALVEHLRRAVRQRPVDDIAMPGDPPDIGGAPVHVGLRLDVEDVPWFPLANPGINAELEVRSLTGVGAEKAAAH